MNFLSFFYYGLNLKFFADVFRLDMCREDITILIPLVLGIVQALGFIYFPLYLLSIHLCSVVFGIIFLVFNLLCYQKKFIFGEDIKEHNYNFSDYLEEFLPKYNLDFTENKLKAIQESHEYDYDKIIDKYEEKTNLSFTCLADVAEIVNVIVQIMLL